MRMRPRGTAITRLTRQYGRPAEISLRKRLRLARDPVSVEAVGHWTLAIADSVDCADKAHRVGVAVGVGGKWHLLIVLRTGC
jgi:hypothetical protein